MIEKVMKAVKSSNKRRGRNITIGVVIGFLLSCTAVMGEDNYLWIRENNGAIEFNITATIDDNGTWNDINPYENAGNIWNATTQTYTNNITLSGTNNLSDSEGYGLRLSEDLDSFNFINNGLMTGTGDSLGYGIYNEGGSIITLVNNGLMTGTGSETGSGINNEGGSITTLVNNGLMTGTGSETGSGTYNSDGGSIEILTNSGVISVTGEVVGSGIYNYYSSITTLVNSGLILGIGNQSVGYGIENYEGSVGALTNSGLIIGTGKNGSSGISNGSSITTLVNSGLIIGRGDNNSGDGIGNSGSIETLTNSGLIIGRGNDGSGISNFYGSITTLVNSGLITGTGDSKGSGIYNYDDSIETLTNTGVIYGKNSAIKNDSGTITTANNYGILVNGSDNDVISGLEIKTSAGENKLVNYGLIIKNNGDGGITAGVEGDQTVKFGTSERNMTIKNAYIEGGSGIGTSTESIELGNNNYDNFILNGKDKTLKVTGSNDKITGSIINAYGTAVVFGEGNKQLTLSGTIVNGGIDENDSNPATKGVAILGSAEGDILILQSGKIKYKDGSEVTQNTVVNGNINMEAGNDNLTIGAGTIVNGTLDGGEGDDTLNFGVSGAKSDSPENEEVRILHNISNFEKMNINTNVTLFEKTIGEDGKETDLKVTGAEKITIGANGVLTLRINSINKNQENKIIGHALYENKGEISSTGGKLLLALNGAGNKEIISFGGTKLNTSLVTEYEGVYYEDVTFGTTSLIHSVKRVNGTKNEVEITVKKNLPLKTLKYEKLNKIYHGILSVDDLIGNFYVNSNESLSVFLGYLNDIYAGNPYSYSSELSRKSVGMFRDIAVESQFKPELNKWLIIGGLTHVDGGTKDTYYGKGYYTYDVGSSDMDADTKITGAYMLGEYGVSDTLTYGVVIGGNKLKSNLSNGSKVDGDALYMGAYAKKYIGNLKVTGGLGLQYGDYDADRIVAGRGITETRSYSDNYNDMTYDIYLNGRYSHNIGNNLFLEPYGTLSYTYVDQEGADEGNKVLAIETDSKTFDYTAAKVGVDLKKVIPHEKGKSTLSAGVSYTRLLTGADEENITGRFKGGSDFDILVAHKNEHSVGLNAKYALELESGILFDVKGSYNVERDSHNESGKNRTKGEWIVGAGLGYKF